MHPHRMCDINVPHNAHPFTYGKGMTQLLYNCPGIPQPCPGPHLVKADDDGYDW